MHVKHAAYEANATALWSLDRGLLAGVDATTDLTITTRKPSKARFQAKARSRLELLHAK